MADPGPSDDLARAAEAALWCERLTSSPAGSPLHAECARWRAADPRNAAALADIEATLRLARAARDDDSIAMLRRETARRTAQTARRRPRMAVAASVAACLSLAGMLAWRSFDTSPAGEVYQTAAGERHTVELADGSTVTLNTRSRVRTEYSRRERRLELETGEAVFEVAKDPRRPFVVMAGGQAVTAHGTVFDVRLGPGQLDVALLEGSIVVKPQAAPAGSGTRVQPGQRLRVSGRTVSLTDIPKLEHVASWRSGIVIFEDTTLSAAVAEMNRYGAQPIRLADAELASLRLSGSFRIDRPDAFLEALELYFPVDAVVAQDGSVLLSARTAAQYARSGRF
jgi:transmembrane sensor